jgi:hypothetical protein
VGGTTFSVDDYNARTTMRSNLGVKTMGYDDDIKKGKRAAETHPSLNPYGVKFRESRDSKEHPVTVPIGVILDTTGSMSRVPEMVQKALPNLMGQFLKERAAGKGFLGEGYPAICVGAVDDYYAQGSDGSFQIGQFESGLEIDDNITNLWLTGNGGGSRQESYDLALYFFARHTVTDHWEKRGRKGHLFIIGDEKTYDFVDRKAAATVIGDSLQADIPIADIMDEVKERWNVYFISPNLTSYYKQTWLREWWTKLVGQNFIELDDPNKICEAIVAAVAIYEENFEADEILDAVGLSGSTALVAMGKGRSVAKGYDGKGLPAPAVATGGVDRF